MHTYDDIYKYIQMRNEPTKIIEYISVFYNL